MTPVILSRLQFGITAVYHFFFVPLTLGLSLVLAVMETLYLVQRDESYKRMAQFWGKLFLINFAVGVVTGLVMEFQFGMNWSEYSRFVGDVFGAPLAIEGLTSFFLESVFLGLWIFGWDRLSRGMHVAAIWLVALGSNLSALWILIANSFMHEPVGYTVANGRAEMTDFGALVTNPHVLSQFPHVLFGGLTVAGFFVLGVGAYHLYRSHPEAVLFRRSMAIATIVASVGILGAGTFGHLQGLNIAQAQPMALAASEAHWETQGPASFNVVALIDESQRRNPVALEIPYVLSLLATNSLTGTVQGMNQLQTQYESLYGPGDYIPPVTVCFWSFRAMVGVGLLLGLTAFISLVLLLTRRLERATWFLRLLPFAIVLPYLATSSGWILTEMGRQPWAVFGLLTTQAAASTAVPLGSQVLSLLLFTLVYGALMAVDAYLLVKTGFRMPAGEPAPEDVPAHPGEPAVRPTRPEPPSRH